MSIPLRATYRLQLRGGMDFDAAIAILPYLQRLGISHLYLSPIFAAARGSTHGYDTTDFNEIDPDLGGRAGFERLSTAASRHAMGIVLDIVPNHMAALPENPWWRDVLERGQSAHYAGHFDIDWRGPLTLPVLEGDFASALQAGEITLGVAADGVGLVMRAAGQEWPLTPQSYGLLPGDVFAKCAALAATPRADFHAAMQALIRRDGRALNAALADLSRDAALLHRLHAAQPWRLMPWRSARESLGYRRFFEVSGLVGTRVEAQHVFADIHRLVLELLHQGLIGGLRIDHIDGLADPAAYLRKLRQICGPDCWIIVEKILARGENLPLDWPVAGTTGYEFIAAMSDLLVPPDGAGVLDRGFRAIADAPDWHQARDQAKREIVTHNFHGELTRLCALLAPFTELPPARVRAGLVELIVALPVYRAYGDARGFDPASMQMLHAAALHAGADAQAVLAALAMPGAQESRLRFQQLSGPVMAKAVEDTVFYRHTAMLARNEVGDDPGHPPAGAAHVHRALSARRGLNATATHDTKRGEDARARLYALAEAPGDWLQAVARWRGWAGQGGIAPATEWLIYQSLAGIWPETHTPASLAQMEQRFLPYIVKSLREAKEHSRWEDVNTAYEDAACAYAARLLAPDNSRFQRDFTATLAPYIQAGVITALGQALIKLCAPGIPDIYQGSEAGDFSLVDPDNRRPVDFAALAQAPDPAPWPAPLAEIKPALIRRALGLRADSPAALAGGAYLPIMACGPQAGRIFAFMRDADGARVIAVAIIRGHGIGAGIGAIWQDTFLMLPGRFGPFTDVLSGAEFGSSAELPLSHILARYPVALLSA